MNKLFTVMICVCGLIKGMTINAACVLKEASVEGKKIIHLENQFLKLRITPDLGGQCTGIIIRQNGQEIEDFTVNLFDDMDWSKSYQDQVFSRVPYSYKILKNTKDQVKVMVEARGTKDYSFFTIRKTYTLNAGQQALRTDYEVHNQPESMGTYTFRLWCHNGLFPKKMKGTYFWSTPNGLHKMKYPGGMNNWEYQSPRGWSGIINEPSTSGIACVMNYSELFALYNWLGDHSANMEWRYMPVRIKNGDSFKTTVWTVPFSGLDRIDYASATGVFAIDINGNSAKTFLNFAPAKEGNYNLKAELRSIAEKKWREVVIIRKISVKPGKNIKIKLPVSKLDKGRYVFRITLNGDGEKDIFERVFSVDGAEDKGEYVYQPVEKKKEYQKEKKYFPYILSQEFVTPHVKWFKPLPDKKLKALFIKDWLRARPVIELAERFDLDFDMPALMNSGYCFTGFVPPRSDNISSHADAKPYLAALEKLVLEKDYDVIIIDRIPLWKNLTSKTQETILDKIKAGTPLMVTSYQLQKSPKLKELFKGAKTPKEMRWYKRKELQGDKGTVRLVSYPSDWSYSYLSHDFGKNLLWVTKREPEVKLNLELPKATKFDQEQLTKAGLNLDFNILKGGNFEIEKVLSQTPEREKLKIVWTENQKISAKAGPNKLNLNFPFMPAGKYQLSVILREKGNVLNSLVKDIEITSPLQATDIKLDKEILKAGEKISGEVLLANDGKSVKSGEGTIELIDNWQRLIDTKKFDFNLPASGKATQKFTFDQKTPLSVINNIRVTLNIDGKDTVTKNVEFTYPGINYQNDDYLGFTWGAPGNAWGRQYAREILKSYCRFNLEQCHSGRQASLRNQQFYHDRLLGNAYNDWQNCKTPGVRKYCLTEQKTIDYVGKNVHRAVDDTWRYGGFAINMGDEASLTHWESPSELCYSPSCMKIFSEWIKEKYPNLDDLNKEWGTSFKAWEEVKPMTEDEVKDRDNLAPWSDFREHMENIWTGFMQKMKNIKDEKCPQAMFSICGVQGGHPYSGYNWWKLRKVFDFVMPYTSAAVLRSFNAKGKYGTYTGYRIDPVQQDKDSWRFFFDGQYVFSYFLSTYPVLADLSISHTYANPIRTNMKRFGEGIGKLFIDSNRQEDKIAIHYSQPSIRINYMMKYREKEINNFIKFYRNARADYENILKDQGYDPLYISYEQIEKGELTPDKWRMLILPLSTALSAKEVEAIKKYVQDGGIVVADCLTGIYDENGKPNKTGSLDELFGIKREMLKKDRLSYRKNQIINQQKPLLLCNEKGIKGNDAEALFKRGGKVSEKIGDYTLREPAPGGGIAWVKKTGKGYTVYLSFLSDYVKNPSQFTETANLFRQILRKVKFPEAEIKVTNDDKTHGLYQVMRHRYQGQNSLFFGLLRRDGLKTDDKPVTAELPGNFHIYDMINKKYLTHGNKFKSSQISGIGRLFAALPYQVKGIKIIIPKTVKVGTEFPVNLQIITDGKQAGFHVLRFTVIQPDGKTAEYYTGNLSAPDGKATKLVPIAMNAKPGKWRISVADTTSGIKSETNFEVVK